MKKANFLYVGTASALCCAFFIALYFLVQTAQPSADVLARVEAQTPRLSVNDFEPGEVRVVLLNNLPIIVWRRNEDDKTLAADQDDPDLWEVHYSNVLGRAEPVPATDENLTLNGEWFFAVAEVSENPGWIPLLRAGHFGGFFGQKICWPLRFSWSHKTPRARKLDDCYGRDVRRRPNNPARLEPLN